MRGEFLGLKAEFLGFKAEFKNSRAEFMDSNREFKFRFAEFENPKWEFKNPNREFKNPNREFRALPGLFRKLWRNFGRRGTTADHTVVTDGGGKGQTPLGKSGQGLANLGRGLLCGLPPGAGSDVEGLA